MVFRLSKYFDEAYERFCDALAHVAVLGESFVSFFVMVTIPLWVIPYLIIRKRRSDEKSTYD